MRLGPRFIRRFRLSPTFQSQMSTTTASRSRKRNSRITEFLQVMEISEDNPTVPSAKRRKLLEAEAASVCQSESVVTTTALFRRARVRSNGDWKEAHLIQDGGTLKLRDLASGELNTVSTTTEYIEMEDWELMSHYTTSIPGTPDHLDVDLKLVFVGFNPGLMSGAARHHYSNPNNHFWHLLRDVGLVPAHMGPKNDQDLTSAPYKIGFTNLVKRISASSAELTKAELSEGASLVVKKMRRFRPRIVCFNGKGVFLPFVSALNPVVAKKLEKSWKWGHQMNLDEVGFPVGIFPEETIFFVMPSTSGRVSGYLKSDKREFFQQLKNLYDNV